MTWQCPACGIQAILAGETDADIWIVRHLAGHPDYFTPPKPRPDAGQKED